eukprot:9281888-Pyramimonas_sp.AAC.1
MDLSFASFLGATYGPFCILPRSSRLCVARATPLCRLRRCAATRQEKAAHQTCDVSQCLCVQAMKRIKARFVHLAMGRAGQICVRSDDSFKREEET